MSEVKLLPCPFCGELPVITKHFKHEMYSFVHRCAVIGPISRDFREHAQDHIDMWNTRVQDSSLDAQRQRADTAEAAFEEGQANWVLCMETLRAAEQRIADLVGLLSRSKKAVDDVAENCEDQRDWQEANSMRALSLKIDAALNPNPEAESHGRIPD